jgi:hypothetical protein
METEFPIQGRKAGHEIETTAPVPIKDLNCDGEAFQCTADLVCIFESLRSNPSY